MSMGLQRVGNDLATKQQSINNVVLISGTQQNNLIIHVFGSILFQILFPVRLLHTDTSLPFLPLRKREVFFLLSA